MTDSLCYVTFSNNRKIMRSVHVLVIRYYFTSAVHTSVFCFRSFCNSGDVFARSLAYAIANFGLFLVLAAVILETSVRMIIFLLTECLVS